MTDTPGQILKNVFGYDRFLPLQQEVIDHVLQKKDSLVIMPTGSGKSICYQIPALLFPGLTVVVSPLISLMKDQVDQLAAVGVPAAVLNSSLSQAEYRASAEMVRTGKTHLLYVAPEALVTEGMLTMLANVRLDCLTIDEAHCISEWGHDFRPEYRRLIEARNRFPQAVCIALTAAATPHVQEDIKTSLGFPDGSLYLASFNRANLFLEVVPKTNALQQTIEIIEKYPSQSGIVYCFSRRQVDEVSESLAARGYAVRPYHAGLDDEDRRKNQEAFVRDDIQIIVATVAFGMGINKPNVRFVVHYDLPKNIESYYQEIGRAGRDGFPAHCRLLFSASDASKIRYFFNEKSPQEQRVANHHLQSLMRYAETHGCRRNPLLAYFGETFHEENCTACDNCLSPDRVLDDLSIPAQKFLSCVKRTGERFGAGYVVDILLGSRNAKVLANGHDQLSTYGIGKEHQRSEWMRFARLLVEEGFLHQEAAYQTLQVTEKALAVLRGQTQVFGILHQHAQKNIRSDEVLEHDQRLFERLRVLRKEMADLAHFPPYIIFSDRSLVEMAAYLPASTDELLTIYGVGRAKLDQYGGPFLQAITEYCLEFGLGSHVGANLNKEKQKSLAEAGGVARHQVIGEAFQAGRSVSELAEAYQVKQTTILSHLEKFAAEGNALPDERILELSALSDDKQQAVIDYFARSGSALLRPAFDAFGGEVSFEELRILRLVLACKRDE